MDPHRHLLYVIVHLFNEGALNMESIMDQFYARFDAHLDVAYLRLYTNRQCIKYWNSRYASLGLCNLQVRIRDLALDGIRSSWPNLGLLVLSKLDGFDCVVHVLCHLDLHSLICQYIISSFVSCPTIQSADFDGTVGGCRNNCQQL